MENSTDYFELASAYRSSLAMISNEIPPNSKKLDEFIKLEDAITKSRSVPELEVYFDKICKNAKSKLSSD